MVQIYMPDYPEYMLCRIYRKGMDIFLDIEAGVQIVQALPRSGTKRVRIVCIRVKFKSRYNSFRKQS